MIPAFGEVANVPELPTGHVYLVEGTLDALLCCIGTGTFLHASSNGKLATAETQKLLSTSPYEDLTFISLASATALNEVPSGVRLFLLCSDINGTTQKEGEKQIKKRACDTVPVLNLTSLLRSVAAHPSIKVLLDKYTPAAKQEMLRLLRFPSKFWQRLEEDAHLAGPIDFSPDWSAETEDLGFCKLLCDALLTPKACEVWQGLTLWQKDYYLSANGKMRDFLVGKTGKGRSPELWVAMQPFVPESPHLFAAWVRLIQARRASTWEGLSTNQWGFYYFRPPTQALEAAWKFKLPFRFTPDVVIRATRS